ncbi:MAG: family 16 glycosylhydrolase [Akkermansiaceae bacterium]|nr:family 16 glycosylhydrolase [Akkermansiaceae bacterium]MCP5550874.1 family 16 glycosylhydrolase [Akkermansiaceae bacterium]
MWAGFYGKYPNATYLTEEDKKHLRGSPFFFQSDVTLPAPPSGMEWKLSPASDEFTYTASPDKKPGAFELRWECAFINPWTGPGKTLWSAGHFHVTNGSLAITATRKQGTDGVLTGILTSRDHVQYPAYVEARVKISNQVLASNVWMLSDDSTEEIDVIEAYGGDRPDNQWHAERLHLSHHVFIRKPFQDYQPTDDGSWYWNGTTWRDGFHRVGVFWRDPWHLEYYVDGKLVRTVSGREKIDPHGYTGGKGLTKPMRIIINMEDQDWRSTAGVTPTDEELADNQRNIMWVDWIRVYEGVQTKQIPAQ